MWQGASELKAAAARGYGAEVDQVATGPAEAFARLDEIRGERVVVHPFDDPLVVAGQGTVGLEIWEDVADVDLVVVPVGGGGLVAGIAVALRAVRPGARIVAVEPERAAALGAALELGRPVSIDPGSVADGLNAPFAGAVPIELCLALGVEHVTVSEREIRTGMRFLYGCAKLAAEPAGAVAVAALLGGKIDPAGAAAVVAVVSGGNVVPETVSDILTHDEG